MTANQEFSKLVREVERGEGFLITRRGRPVAKLVPHSADKDADPEWAAAPPAHDGAAGRGSVARRAQDRTGRAL